MDDDPRELLMANILWLLCGVVLGALMMAVYMAWMG